MYINKQIIVIENIEYEVLLRKSNSKKVIVLPSTSSLENENLVFQYEKITEFFGENIILIKDPTIKYKDVQIGWGQGSSKKFYIDDMAMIVGSIINKIGLNIDDAIFIGAGSSAFLTIMIATLLKGKRVIVSNPQLNLINYYQKHIKKLIDNVYDGINISEYKELFKTRYSVFELFKVMNYIPNIVIYSNSVSEFDISTQITPFINQIIKEKPDFAKNINFKFYYDSNSKNKTLNIEKLINLFIKEIKGSN